MDFVCNKEKVKEILEYHQLKCSCDVAYNRILNHLSTMTEDFEYNFFMSEISILFLSNKLSQTEYDNQRFYNAFKERMRRYKLDVDWKDLNAKLPKMTKAKRLRKERKAKVEKINKNREL